MRNQTVRKIVKEENAFARDVELSLGRAFAIESEDTSRDLVQTLSGMLKYLP